MLKSRAEKLDALGGAGASACQSERSSDRFLSQWSVLRKLTSLVVTTILGGLLTAALVRNSPGFDSDERLLDPRLDSASIAAIHAEHAASHDILRLFGRMLHGDFGVSPSLNRPISELLVARLPVTLRLMGVGILAAWASALAFAIAAVTGRSRILSRVAATVSAGTLCMPSAVVAILVFALGGPVIAVIPLVLFPQTLRERAQSAGECL